MDFHDARIEQVEFSVSEKRVRALLCAYVEDSSRARTRFAVTVSGVSFVSFAADFAELNDNASAGNVVHVRSAAEEGSVAFYLAGGIMMLNAEDVTIEALSEDCEG